MNKLFDVKYIEDKLVITKPDQLVKLRSSTIIRALEIECNPIKTGSNGVVAYTNGVDTTYFFETSSDNKNETLFDINGYRILNKEQLPVIVKELSRSYLNKDRCGSIVYISHKELTK